MPSRRKKEPLQLVIGQQLCIMEEYEHKDYGLINIIYEDVNGTQVDRSKSLICLNMGDMGFFKNSVMPSTCAEISLMLFNLVNKSKLFFTDPETRELLLLRIRLWITKKDLTDF